MKCLYVSDDGKFQSEDEWAVEEYEYQSLRNDLKVVILDEDGEVIDDYDAAYFLYIPDEAAYSRFVAFAEDNGTCIPDGAGYYLWDDCIDNYISINDRINELNNKVTKYKSMRDKLTELSNQEKSTPIDYSLCSTGGQPSDNIKLIN